MTWLYLSMLSSQLSPIRSSSESDCRETKQTQIITSTEEVICVIVSLQDYGKQYFD